MPWYRAWQQLFHQSRLCGTLRIVPFAVFLRVCIPLFSKCAPIWFYLPTESISSESTPENYFLPNLAAIIPSILPLAPHRGIPSREDLFPSGTFLLLSLFLSVRAGKALKNFYQAAAKNPRMP